MHIKIDKPSKRGGGDIADIDKGDLAVALGQQRDKAGGEGIPEDDEFPFALCVRILDAQQRLRSGEKNLIGIAPFRAVAGVSIMASALVYPGTITPAAPVNPSLSWESVKAEKSGKHSAAVKCAVPVFAVEPMTVEPL